MNFRASFCDPFMPDIIEIGDIEKDKVIEIFNRVPWTEYLEKMKTANYRDIHYSPSLEIENKDNRNGLSVSAVDGVEWYIFFKRPKRVKRFLGLSEIMHENYLTDIQGQTEKDRTARIVSNAILMNEKHCPLSFRTVDSIDNKKAMLLFYEQNNISKFKEIFINQFEFAVKTYF